MKFAILILGGALLIGFSAHAQIFNQTYKGIIDLTQCVSTPEYYDSCRGEVNQKYAVTVTLRPLSALKRRAGVRESVQTRVGDIDTSASSRIECQDQVTAPAFLETLKVTALDGQVVIETQKQVNAFAVIARTYSEYGATNMICPDDDFAARVPVALEQKSTSAGVLPLFYLAEGVKLEVKPQNIQASGFVVAKKDGSAALSTIAVPVALKLSWVAFSSLERNSRNATTSIHGESTLVLAP